MGCADIASTSLNRLLAKVGFQSTVFGRDLKKTLSSLTVELW